MQRFLTERPLFRAPQNAGAFLFLFFCLLLPSCGEKAETPDWPAHTKKEAREKPDLTSDPETQAEGESPPGELADEVLNRSSSSHALGARGWGGSGDTNWRLAGRRDERSVR